MIPLGRLKKKLRCGSRKCAEAAKCVMLLRREEVGLRMILKYLYEQRADEFTSESSGTYLDTPLHFRKHDISKGKYLAIVGNGLHDIRLEDGNNGSIAAVSVYESLDIKTAPLFQSEVL